MSAPARTISQFLTSDVTHELRDVGATALRFWRRTLAWIFAIAVAAAAVIFAADDVIPDAHGFFIGLFITVALFPPAVSAGLEAGGKWDRSRAGVLLLSATLVSLLLAIANGYWLPYVIRGGPDERPPFHLDSRNRIGFNQIRMLTQTELLETREELSAIKRAVEAELRALDSGRTRPPNVEALPQQMLALRERVETHGGEIAWMGWLRRLRTALSFLPLVSVGLGFMVGRWATLMDSGLRRQLFTWSIGLPIVCGTGYSLATATEYTRSVPRFDEFAGSPFVHILIVPVVTLVALICLWHVGRPRVSASE